ncbi:hypothetical protein ACFV85_07550, partial [Streptomyces niveus]|uniref:hypothetical protein n=1 Tax=Streptomyces niveus TaxID=193462 RepID=UPI0036575114
NLNPIHETVNPVGVSTYLALTFGTLLSSQGTDASFGPVSGPSGLPFGSCCVAILRFRLYQNLSAPDSQSAGLSFRPCGRSDE